MQGTNEIVDGQIGLTSARTLHRRLVAILDQGDVEGAQQNRSI